MESWGTHRTSYAGSMKVVTVGAGAAVFAVVLVKTWRHLYRSLHSTEADVVPQTVSCIMPPKVFTLQEVKAATGNLSASNLVSKSEMWCMYKGELGSVPKLVAVKVFALGAGREAEFKHEIAVMDLLHHPNIVSLEGVCEEDGMLALIYGCTPGATLESRLFGVGMGGMNLAWHERYKAALGVARALAYLHHDCEDRIVCHREVKLSNVLVTDDTVVRLCNFGRAWYRSKSESKSPGGGTAAEDMEADALSKEDVYAFGVLLLQLVTGRQAAAKVEANMWHVADWVSDAVQRCENWEGITDPTMGTIDRSQIKVLLLLGLQCCQSNASARPNMSEALRVLSGDADLPAPLSRTKEEIFNFPVQFGADPAENMSLQCWLGPETRKQLQLQTHHKVFKLPYSRNLYFKGREKDLCAIREAFETSSAQAPCVSICGLGGVGKTQLALEYAYRSLDLYDGLLWVAAADDVENRYAALSKVLGLKIPSSASTARQIEAVRKELEGDRKYLLILDNINEDILDKFRPKVGASHLLLTTRVNLVYVIPHKLEIMSNDEALQVLEGTGGPWTAQTEILLSIAEELGRLPLALAAAAHLLSNNHSPSSLLHKIKINVGQCMDKAPPDLTFQKSSSLSELFDVSLEQLSNLPDRELTRAIFLVAGHFSPEAIPLPLLTVAAQFFMGKEPDADEDGEFAVTNLVRLSLAMRDKDGDLVFHRVVQSYARSKADANLANSAILKALVQSKCLRKAVPHHQHLWEVCKTQLTQGEWSGDDKLLPYLALLVGEYFVIFQSARFRESIECQDLIMAMGPERAGKGYFDTVVARLTLFMRILGNRNFAGDSKELLASALKASEGYQEAALARLVLHTYDILLNWTQGDKEQERKLYALTDSILLETQLLEERREAPNAAAWGQYFYKGRDYGTVLAGLEVLGWIFTTRVADHRLAVRLYTAAEHTSGQYCAWGPGAVGYLYARLEREARVLRLIGLAFSLPCGASIPRLAAALKEATAGPAFPSGKGREREERKELLRRHAVKTVEWISEGRGNVRSTLVLAIELGELGLLTGGAEGRDLIRKAAALLEKELPEIEKTCGVDSLEVSSTLYRLATLYRYLGGKGLRRSQQILESRIQIERDQKFAHRELRFYFLLAQIYFEQCLLEAANAQLARTLEVQTEQVRDSWRVGRVLELQAAVRWLQGDSATAATLVDRPSASGIAQIGSDAADLQGIRDRIRQWESNGEKQRSASESEVGHERYATAVEASHMCTACLTT